MIIIESNGSFWRIKFQLNMRQKFQFHSIISIECEKKKVYILIQDAQILLEALRKLEKKVGTFCYRNYKIGASRTARSMILIFCEEFSKIN